MDFTLYFGALECITAFEKLIDSGFDRACSVDKLVPQDFLKGKQTQS